MSYTVPGVKWGPFLNQSCFETFIFLKKSLISCFIKYGGLIELIDHYKWAQAIT